VERWIAENKIKGSSGLAFKAIGPDVGCGIFEMVLVVGLRTFDRHGGFIAEDELGVGIELLRFDADHTVGAAEVEDRLKISVWDVFEEEARADVELVAAKEVRVVAKREFKGVELHGLWVGRR